MSREFPLAIVFPDGVIRVNGYRLDVGDGIAVTSEPTLIITAEADAEVILVATS